MLFVCHPKCSTCAAARKWLDGRGIEYAERDIRTSGPTREELAEWLQESGLPLKRFFNTSGMAYRALELKDKLPNMPESEQIALLASDGMLVRRPILVGDGVVLVGFKQEEWENAFKNE